MNLTLCCSSRSHSEESSWQHRPGHLPGYLPQLCRPLPVLHLPAGSQRWPVPDQTHIYSFCRKCKYFFYSIHICQMLILAYGYMHQPDHQYRKFSEISAALGNSATVINQPNNYWGNSPTPRFMQGHISPKVGHQVNFIDIRKKHLDFQSLRLILDY